MNEREPTYEELEVRPAETEQVIEALTGGEVRCRQILESANEGVWMLDLDGVTTYVNARMAAILGYEPAEMIGRSLFDFVWPEDVPVAREKWEQRRAETGGRRVEKRYRRKDGRPVWCLVSSSLIRDAEGRTTGVLGMVTDITERKRAEAERERLLAERTAVMESMADGLTLADPTGRIIYHNPASLTLHGYSSMEEALLEREQVTALWELIDMAGRPVPVEEWPMPRALRGETFSGYELRARRRDTGKAFIGSYRGRLVRDAAGAPLFAMLTVRDVTERKQEEEELAETVEELQVAEEELRQQNEELCASRRTIEEGRRRYEELFEFAPDGYLVTDEAGMIREANRDAARLLGTSQELLVGKPLVLFVPQEGRDVLRTQLRNMADLRRADWEMRVQPRDGVPFHAAITVAATRDRRDGGGILRWLIRDVTEQKRAEKERALLLARAQQERERAEQLVREIQRANSLLYALLETMPAGVMVSDRDGAILMVNAAGESIVGGRASGSIYQPEKAYTLHWLDGSPMTPEEFPLRHAIEDGKITQDLEVLIRRGDGTERTILVGAAPAWDEGGAVVSAVAVFQDITARREAEEALRESEERFRTVADFTYDWEYWLGPEGDYVYVSPSCEHVTGYNRGEFLERPGLIQEIIHPDDRVTFEEHWREEHEEGEVYSLDFRIVARDGQERWINHVCRPVYDAAGRYLGRRGSNRDITQRKRAEEQREQLLAQAEADRRHIRSLAEVLERERNILQTIMENTHAHLAYLDPQFNFVRVNSAYAQGSGYRESELIGRNHFEFFPDAENQAIFERVRETGEAATFHARPFVFPDRPELGTTYWDWTLVPVKREEDGVRGLVFSLLDVTERERARQEREAYLDRLQRLILVSEEILAETTVEGVLQRAVDAGCELSGARACTAGHGYEGERLRVDAFSGAGDVLATWLEGFSAEYLDLIKQAVSLRLTEADLHQRPAWDVPERQGPLRGLLGARLVARGGQVAGFILAADAEEGDFTAEDEALLVQLAALTSLALQHIEARSEAEQRADELSTVFAAMNEGVVVYDVDGVPVRANPVARIAYGFDPMGGDREELARKLEVRHSDGRPVSLDGLPSSRALEGERLKGQRFIFSDAHGEEVCILASAAPLYVNDILSGSVVTWHDITELEQTRAQLEAERARLRAIIENAPEAVVVADREGRIVLANPAAEKIYARPVPYGADFESHRALQLCYPDGTPYEPRNLPLMRSVLDGERYSNLEMTIVWPDDQRRDLLASTAPIQDAYGEISGAVGIFQDITVHKETERTLRQYADRLWVLHEMDHVILASQSPEEIAQAALPYTRRLVSCLRVSVSLFDFENEEMMFIAVEAEGETRLREGWRGPLYRAEVLRELGRGRIHVVEDLGAVSSPSPLIEALQAEGVRSYVSVPLVLRDECIGSLNLGMGEPGRLTSVQMDIVQEMADQLAVGIRQAQLYEQVQSHASVLEKAVVRRTRELRVSEARFRAIFEGAGIGVARLDREARLQESNPALQEMLGYGGEELRGKPLVEIIHPDDAAADLETYRELLAGEHDRRRLRLERRLVRKDGQLRWANVMISMVGRDEGQPQFAIGMVEDITRRKQAVEALIRAEKLSLAGKLAASLAHEINNPLQSVIGCLGLAEETLAEEGDVSRYLEVARGELKRAARIVGQLRDLHRQSEMEAKERTDVNALLERVLMVSKKQCEKSGVEVIWEPDDELLPIGIMPDRMHQVFLNLVLNAVQAMPEGGRLEISTSSTDEPAGVKITFVDSGPGIPSHVQDRIFEPFYSTKSEGLGLGLFISHDIVRQHGGRIELDSEIGAGTTFMVWLPREDEEGSVKRCAVV